MKPRTQIARIGKKKLARLGGKMPFSTIASPRKAVRKSKRKPPETLRIYGGKKRIEWMKLRDCWYRLNFGGFGCAGEIQNAHTVNGGRGRKADADTIIPLCASHHGQYDKHEPPFDTDEIRGLAKRDAQFYERSWLSIKGE